MTELILKRASPSPPATVIGVSNATASVNAADARGRNGSLRQELAAGVTNDLRFRAKADIGRCILPIASDAIDPERTLPVLATSHWRVAIAGSLARGAYWILLRGCP